MKVQVVKAGCVYLEAENHLEDEALLMFLLHVDILHNGTLGSGYRYVSIARTDLHKKEMKRKRKIKATLMKDGRIKLSSKSKRGINALRDLCSGVLMGMGDDDGTGISITFLVSDMETEHDIDIDDCARCTRSHLDVPIMKLKHPSTINGHVCTYWALCPTTFEPIFVFVDYDHACFRAERRTEYVVYKRADLEPVCPDRNEQELHPLDIIIKPPAGTKYIEVKLG